jgi:adenylosuccinate lyase
VGKRACLWLQDFVSDLERVSQEWRNLPLRGVKGTTGTQASYLHLFQGDHAKVSFILFLTQFDHISFLL